MLPLTATVLWLGGQALKITIFGRNGAPNLAHSFILQATPLDFFAKPSLEMPGGSLKHPNCYIFLFLVSMKPKFAIALAIGGTLLFTVFSCTGPLGRSGYESAPYTTVQTDGAFEIRDYPEIVVATATMADGRNSQDSGFYELVPIHLRKKRSRAKN